jgi:hypothetical protein
LAKDHQDVKWKYGICHIVGVFRQIGIVILAGIVLAYYLVSIAHEELA